MEYTKPPLTFEEQAQLLIQRGLITSKEEIVKKFGFVNYYRFSSYLYTFKIEGGEDFKKGTKLSTVWNHYKFDRDFRSLVFKALEVIEVALRTKITYHFSHEYGPFGYIENKNLPFFEQEAFEVWKSEICEEIANVKDYAVTHFYEKYFPEHTMPPLWIASEYMTFGKIVTMYRKLEKDLQNLIAKVFNVPTRVFKSWILSLNYVRNVCAHHGRLWNIRLRIKPLLPKGTAYEEWVKPVRILNDKMFGILTILNFLTKQIDAEYRFKDQLKSLLQKHPLIPVSWIGFPADWEKSPLWAESSGGSVNNL